MGRERRVVLKLFYALSMPKVYYMVITDLLGLLGLTVL